MFAILFLYLYNNKENKKQLFKNLFYSCCLVVLISIFLSEIQTVIFPSARLFFADNLKDILYSKTEEVNYIAPFSIQSIINQIKNMFYFAFVSPKVVTNYKNDLILFRFSNANHLIFLIISLPILILVLNFIKHKKINKKPFLLFLCFSFIFNFILHTFYGNSEAFLYTLHYLFVLILIVACILKDLKWDEVIYTKIYLMFLLIIQLIFNFSCLINMFNKLDKFYVDKGNMNMVIIIIFVVVLLCLIKIITKMNKQSFLNLKNKLLERK